MPQLSDMTAAGALAALCAGSTKACILRSIAVAVAFLVAVCPVAGEDKASKNARPSAKPAAAANAADPAGKKEPEMTM
ncbi:MAG: hypothetical protein RLZ98_549 [Pseudomonadota bacterium]|jgi:uncharacterized membrane protein YebE (DUF533 family)